MNLFITVGVPGSGKTTWAKEKHVNWEHSDCFP